MIIKKDNIVRRICLFLLSPFSFILLAGCEVDFTPNAEWKETPVVYCLLDQDEDTTWVRIEKCYLSEGDIYQPGSISDSINYPAGALDIKLYAIRDNNIVDSFPFNYTLRDRDSGSFVYQQQPLYWAYTRRKLREDCFYRLIVRHADNGDTLILAETPLIVKNDGSVVYSVNGAANKFSFPFNGMCEIKWRSLNNARLYQPIVRFYYTVYGDTLYVDAPCAMVSARNQANLYSTSYSREAFLNYLHEQLKDDPRPKGYPKVADIYITACSEDLNAYINSVSSIADIEQGRENYTNIRGGLGVFAARRTHLYKRVDCDSSDSHDPAHPGLNYLLHQLGVGF